MRRLIVCYRGIQTDPLYCETLRMLRNTPKTSGEHGVCRWFLLVIPSPSTHKCTHAHAETTVTMMTNKWVYSSSGLSSLEWLDVSDMATQASVFCRFGETRRQTYTHSYTHTPNHTQNGNKTSFLCSTLNSCSAAGRLSAAWIPFTASSARFDAPFRVRTRGLPFGRNQ